MANVSTSQKVCIRNYAVTYHISTIQNEFMDLEQLNPLSEETGISVDPMVVTWIYQVFQ